MAVPGYGDDDKYSGEDPWLRSDRDLPAWLEHEINQVIEEYRDRHRDGDRRFEPDPYIWADMESELPEDTRTTSVNVRRIPHYDEGVAEEYVLAKEDGKLSKSYSVRLL